MRRSGATERILRRPGEDDSARGRSHQPRLDPSRSMDDGDRWRSDGERPAHAHGVRRGTRLVDEYPVPEVSVLAGSGPDRVQLMESSSGAGEGLGADAVVLDSRDRHVHETHRRRSGRDKPALISSCSAAEVLRTCHASRAGGRASAVRASIRRQTTWTESPRARCPCRLAAGGWPLPVCTEPRGSCRATGTAASRRS